MRTDHSRGRFHSALHKATWVVSAVGTGAALVMWRIALHQAEQRAEEAERTRDEVARRRAVEERLRIARELHDSLTHSISVIQVQAGVAVHLARKRGEEVPPALLAITEAATDASRELRTTLGALRSNSSSGSYSTAGSSDRRAQVTGSRDGRRTEPCDGTGLTQLDGLVARTRSAGLPVTVRVTGTERPLPPDVDQAAYRIVQEALTNTSRHAGPARASVHLHYGGDALTVQVDDDGAGTATPSPGPGLGLTGMRERVSPLGGRLRTGPRESGGYRVQAELPVRK
jgi:signal transduction histidine kinase